MLSHDRSRSIGDKVFIGQFFPDRHQLGFGLGDFFSEPLPFRFNVDQSLERQVELAEWR